MKIVAYLTAIHEFRGEQRAVTDRYENVLMDLVQIARIQSTESSNRMEGIYTSDEQLRKLVMDKVKPRSGDERELAGDIKKMVWKILLSNIEKFVRAKYGSG